ncbi:Rac3b, Rho family GTPase [Monocercomonoides exilis]|uniref:Rac3b, Rho family GTPase n=1 Tax=Monocercomonoides exilis TaxID=2049356 RepID=UPI00355A020C|nr:Rac3b, Rho family GTPase [Monocercomonoides exilis]|eukprot:MONOS_2110.1-p1 / transcript=MONOS_2110.1 / gene=MONOS_2110 / organism=Monocercomonoides_exilis_PA203 / gene_product=Rac3b, Rho family GTPase / transcript_product=Rac3b, Rho family GTPase / location=Mono_scaffold00041:120169-121179(-) / protein_length=186 / sequence_SO=supercontig / SO=protein_coding / is_pseudo=false
MAEDLKVVVVGDGAVGKTSLLYVYVNNSFPDDHIPTVYDNYNANASYNGKPVMLSIWDTAGQYEFDDQRQLAYADTNVVLMCFCTVEKSSLTSIQTKWYPEITRFIKDPIIVLAGTKIDLRDADEKAPDVCTDEMIQEVAKSIKAAGVVLCSAKERRNVEEVFQSIMKAHFEPPVAAKSGCCVIM